MKKIKQLAACFMAMALLCCGCSVGGPGQSEPKDAAALPLAELDASIPAGFSDVPDGAWYAEAAGWGLANGVFDAGVFSPQVAMYRPMVAEALYRAAGSPAVGMAASFPDVPEGRYTAPTAWAAEQGLMSGYANGNFGLNDPVTREQMAAILWRYAGSPAAPAGEDFADEASIAGFAKTTVDWARENGVVNGKDGNLFDPKGILTRAQTAVILHRYLTGGKDTGDAVVYMTTDISSDGLLSIYKALDWTPGKQVAEDHGYTAIAEVDIMDENGSMTLPVTGGEHLTENYVGANFARYDFFLVLSHFKGHAMAGFGGAIKNISIGIASAEGKCCFWN